MRTFQIRPYYLKKEDLRIPALDGGDSEIGKLLENAYNEALHVMFNVNCVNRNGKALFVAGGEYSDVWTRDGSYNSYAAGSFLAPHVTENTLRALLADGMVNGSIAGGSFDDLQFWDKQLWIIAAYRHWLITRNSDFLQLAAGISIQTLAYQEEHYFVPEFSLFRGPGFFLDSIGALPMPYARIVDGKSCVAEYPDAVKVMTLSTNSIYVQAYRDAAAILDALGRDASLAAQYREKADSLAEVIRNRFFRNSPNGIPAYFIHGTGPQKGEPAFFQEGSGLGFSLLFGIADESLARNVFDQVHLEPNGLPVIWPNLKNDYLGSGKTGSTDSGYHTPQNITIWPQVNGIWMLGCAAFGKTELLGSELENFCRLIQENNGIWEIYHARTGNPKLWGHPAKKHQNWGAAALLSAVHHGIFGLTFTKEGFELHPNLPSGWGTLRLSGVRINGALLDITLRGAGNRIARCAMDGVPHETSFSSIAGSHRIELELSDCPAPSFATAK